MKKALIILTILTLSLGAFPLPALGLSYNPENVISNEDFFNSTAMSAEDIQTFLQNKGSSLANYKATDIDGATKRASDIIARSAKQYGISPKVLLVLLQKEQSLIENPNPSQYAYDWATGFARCDSCSADDPRIQGYKGFVNQVDRAAWRKVYYTTNPLEFNYRVGKTTSVDGIPLTPSNSATAALYNYTPHMSAGYSFWKLWLRYFGKVFPDGTVVQETGSKNIWLIQGGKKRLFASMSAFLSRYSQDRLVSVSKNDLDTYATGDPIRFAQYSLLQSPKGAIFLIVDDKKFGITSAKVFKQIGFNRDEVVKVSQKDLDDIPTGGSINKADANPMGELVKDPRSGGVYYVQNHVKSPIIDGAILAINFPYRKVVKGNAKELDAMPTGDPIKIADGTLVISKNTQLIYAISNGEKRLITTKQIFEQLGFQWTNVVTVNDTTLELHPDGAFIDIGEIVPSEPPAILAAAAANRKK